VRFDLDASAPVELRLLRAAHERKLDPFRRSSVRPPALRDCRTSKTPDAKSLDCGVPFASRALVNRTVPRRVSSSEPTGICRAWLSGTNLRPLRPGTEALARAGPLRRAEPLARAAPPGTLTKTWPFTGSTLTVFASTGSGTACTVNVRRAASTPNVEAGLGSALPAWSIARTWNVCVPGPSGGVVNGEAHGVNAPPSMLHSKRDPGSLEVNSKVGVLSLVEPEGPAVIIVSGGVVSPGGGGGGALTVKPRLAGVASTLPAASRARTSKVCGPGGRPAVVWEPLEPQGANAPSSILHSKLEPASLEVKVNVGVESSVGPDGPPVIVVSGGVASIPIA
jgi:hypothetical protein